MQRTAIFVVSESEKEKKERSSLRFHIILTHCMIFFVVLDTIVIIITIIINILTVIYSTTN